MKLPIVILGAGGHSKVLLNILLMQGMSILGITDRDPKLAGTSFKQWKILGNDDYILNFPPNEIILVNGVGSIKTTEHRKMLYLKFKEKGYSFFTTIHPNATIASDVHLSEGVQIMAGVIIQPDCHIGENCIINTGSSIDHDCFIGAHTHIAPGAILSGNVRIGSGVHIGTGAIIIQGVVIGDNCTIGAGTVVLKHVADNSLVIGVPGRVSKLDQFHAASQD